MFALRVVDRSRPQRRPQCPEPGRSGPGPAQRSQLWHACGRKPRFGSDGSSRASGVRLRHYPYTFAMNDKTIAVTWTGGTEHWTKKGEVKLFLWNKKPAPGTKLAGTILFVHGSSMASQPTFDLHVPGRPDSSAMDWFAARGYDTWTMDNEGYGRSDKHRSINCDIANGADDLAAGSRYILDKTGAKNLLVYGISSGALKAALFAERHPERVARL